MIRKLALRNMRRNMRDYGIYFLTLLFGVSIFYMFNSIYAQKDMMSVTEMINQSMVALQKILSYISVFVSFVLGGLIVYANNYFIRRRKKELGVYLTLGMDKKDISTILLLETSALAVVALGFGLMIGVFGSQFMSFFTASMFDVDMTKFTFVFSMDAAIKSVIYFALIFVVVAVFNVFNINRVKLIDLLYGGRKNENIRIKSVTVSLLFFVGSLACLGGSYFLIIKNGIIETNMFFIISIVLGIIGTLLFFFSVSGFLITLIQRKKNIYLKDLNMFVTRQLGSKLNTNYISVSIVCLILFLVIGIFSTGYSIQTVTSNQVKESVSYNFSLISDGKEVSMWEELPEDIKNKVTDHNEIQAFTVKDTGTYESLNVDLSTVSNSLENRPFTFITVSDFNKISEMQGLGTIDLDESEYAIVSYNDKFDAFGNEILKQKSSIRIDNTTLQPVKAIPHTRVSNSDYMSMYFIVSDKYKDYLSSHSEYKSQYLNMNTSTSENEQSVNTQLKKISEKSGAPFLYYASKLDIYATSVTTKVIVAFLAIYLGIVFMICCAAILAIQQLSEAADNRERYLLLQKLGTEKRMIKKALFTQIISYFLFPLVLSIIHSIIGLTAVFDVIQKFGKENILQNLITTGVFVLTIYGAYFIVTYMGCKNIVFKKTNSR